MNRLNCCFVFIGLSIALAGCAKDRSFLPPAKNEYVTVTIKVGNELKAEPMRVMYRSAVCKYAKYDGNFRRTDVDGYHSFELPPQRNGETDLYEVKLPKDGGGQCRWQLSNVTFGVVYGNPKRFGGNAVAGGGGGVVVVFDENNSQRGGRGVYTEGDLKIIKDYYPWVHEGFLGGYRKAIKLVGGPSIFLNYYAPVARSVYFEPNLHSEFLIRSIGPKIKKQGTYTTYTYPDGSVYSDGKWHPNLNRLNDIRRAIESKK